MVSVSTVVGTPFQLTSCPCTAGNPTTFAQTCPGACYDDYVLGPPSNYDNAYFEIQSVRVFGTSAAVVTQGPSNGASRSSTGVFGFFGLTVFLMLLIAS